MHLRSAKLFFGFFCLSFLIVVPLSAQDAPSELSGIITDSAGKTVPNVKVTAKNLSTGGSTYTQSDSAGSYSFRNLAPGDYEISVSVEGLSSPARATITAGGSQTVNLSLSATLPPHSPSASSEQHSETLPNAPSNEQTAPSLADLGFSKTETQSNAAQQALLDKRTRMLKIHQRMGLITTIPMVASVVTSLNAGGHSEGTASRDLHVALGALTGDLYGITAWYAIRAPRIPGTETRGPIRFHKAMAWIHGPGMILTPILGAMAFSQKNNGEKVHGIASAHGAVAIVTAGAYGAALLSVSVKF